MVEKKSFYEIITNKLRGHWCEGLCMLEVSDDEIQITNIYSNNGEENSINNYPIHTDDRVFSQVVEMDYAEAIKAFTENQRTIISPKVSTDEIITFNGLQSIRFGGNVFVCTEENKIVVNDKEHFDTFDEILNLGFISQQEKSGKWKVFDK